MKVAMLLGRSTGGIGTHVAVLSADLRELGAEVIIVTDPLTARHFNLGSAAEVRLWWPGSAGWARALGDFALLRHLVSGCDIVHAHGNQAALLATLATLGVRERSRRAKVVVSQHNAVLQGSGRARLKRRVQRWVTHRADLVTGASGDLVEQAMALGARRAELAEVSSPKVPGLLSASPADASTRAETRATLLSSVALDQVDPARPLVVTVSRIAPQKNLPVLVEAAALLRSPCTWVVLGDGDPERLAELRAQTRAFRAPVHFVGAHSDISTWLRAAEVFVLPSEWEARALVVQEAMAAGTPVVATDVGGLHDLVDGTGFLVIPGDAGAIAAAADRVLRDPGLREDLAARGRKLAMTFPDGRDTATRWLERYAETLLMT